MNENIKAMCLELAKLALETKDVDVDLMNYAISVFHYSYKYGKVKTLYYENINFIDEDAEQRINETLEYVRGLGGNKDV